MSKLEMKESRNDWEMYKVRTPKDEYDRSCVQFDSVSHTSHIANAINIVQSHEVSPSLVYDESKLNKKRILVVWLSPNHWGGTGFRYGNVRFDFAFDGLIKGKKFYWVESIEKYKIPACRILITDRNRSTQLLPYNPKIKNGPWWFDSDKGKHFYNNNYCLEFMVEDSVSLENLSKLDFVAHHKEYCSIHRYNQTRCSELGIDSNKGGAIFLTRAIVSGTDLTNLRSFFINGNTEPLLELISPFDEFSVKISSNIAFKGSITASSREATALIHAVMSAFTYNRIEEAQMLATMYDSKDTFIKVTAREMCAAVGSNDFKTLINKSIIPFLNDGMNGV
jgi:hypothetical protein